jgi:hypothetical protein
VSEGGPREGEWRWIEGVGKDALRERREEGQGIGREASGSRGERLLG